MTGEQAHEIIREKFPNFSDWELFGYDFDDMLMPVLNFKDGVKISIDQWDGSVEPESVTIDDGEWKDLFLVPLQKGEEKIIELYHQFKVEKDTCSEAVTSVARATGYRRPTVMSVLKIRGEWE